MRQVAGGDDVRQHDAGFAPGAQALGQMDLEEAAALAAQPAERIERLDHARALGPAAADAAGQRDDRDLSGGQRRRGRLAIARGQLAGGVEQRSAAPDLR